MSRANKYRAWDIEGKCWIPQSQFAIFADGRKQFLSCNEDTGYFCFDEIEIITEQFIGLTDKNGVEIFEGDVVERDLNGRVEPAVVVYVEELCAFMWQTVKNYHVGFDGGNADFFNSKTIKSNIGWTVIGNIREGEQQPLGGKQ